MIDRPASHGVAGAFDHRVAFIVSESNRRFSDVVDAAVVEATCRAGGGSAAVAWDSIFTVGSFRFSARLLAFLGVGVQQSAPRFEVGAKCQGFLRA